MACSTRAGITISLKKKLSFLNRPMLGPPDLKPRLHEVVSVSCLAWACRAHEPGDPGHQRRAGLGLSGRLSTALAQLQGGQEDTSYILLHAGECKQA